MTRGLLAIDVGGSKTLLAVFSETGKIIYENKLKTKKNYDDFLQDLRPLLQEVQQTYHIVGCCCAIPGRVNHDSGVGESFGNLKWHNVPIRRDISQMLGGMSVLVENDAKLAGLSEALNHKRFKRVLYVTISTGIGDGVIIDGKISPDFSHSESGQMVLRHQDELKQWEDISSGRALVERYGKRAADIDDPKIWKEFVADIALGLQHLIAVVNPEVVIIGGSVGTYFPKYGHFLNEELKKMENDMVEVPPVIQAERPEEAVIYGCYEFIKQNG